MYCASILILGILFCICTYQGIAQRKEQFIIYAIREKYFKDKEKEDKEKDKEEYKNILPDGYQPFDKKGLEVIQGLYGELVKIFFGVAIILTILTIWKICFACLCNCIVLFAMLFCCTLFCICCYYYCKQQCSYMDRQLEYTQKKITYKGLSENKDDKNKNNEQSEKQ